MKIVDGGLFSVKMGTGMRSNVSNICFPVAV